MRRRGNNEGSIYYTVEKHKRKKFRNEGECSICKNCTDRTPCDGRTGWIKCQKCKDCKVECLKYCDRFDCYGKYNAQITVDGKQTTVGASIKRKEVAMKKLEIEAKVQTKNYVKKNGITLLEIIKKIDDDKLKNGTISESTYYSNKPRYKIIENFNFTVPIQNLTIEQIQKQLDSIKYLSDSEINKIYTKIKGAFDKAIKDKIISYSDNPMNNVTKPKSEQTLKKVEAFEIYEQISLMNYVGSNKFQTNSLCSYDKTTIKNIILLGLLTGMRIGELGALNYEKDIDFKRQSFIVKRTLTKDKDGKTIMGKYTKTGRLKEANGQIDEREIPFNIFDEDLVLAILNEQIAHAKTYPNNNVDTLLFRRSNGKYIVRTGINTLFKRICKEINLKPNLIKGCHIHMTRHTFITRLIEARY